jgi:hypothetical protein
MKVYQRIAQTLQAMETCRGPDKERWRGKHERCLRKLVRDHMPRNSGFDDGTRLFEKSTHNKLIFVTAFHHLDDSWTNHVITVTPSLTCNFDLRISGKDHNEIKYHILEEFDYALRQDIGG